MKRPPISDAQMDLLATRLAAGGVGRRDFLRVAAGLAAMGAAGSSRFWAPLVAGTPARGLHILPARRERVGENTRNIS